jgi:hypothetical protein
MPPIEGGTEANPRWEVDKVVNGIPKNHISIANANVSRSHLIIA